MAPDESATRSKFRKLSGVPQVGDGARRWKNVRAAPLHDPLTEPHGDKDEQTEPREQTTAVQVLQTSQKIGIVVRGPRTPGRGLLTQRTADDQPADRTDTRQQDDQGHPQPTRQQADAVGVGLGHLDQAIHHQQGQQHHRKHSRHATNLPAG